MNISYALKIAMVRQGIKQSELSESTGYSFVYVSDLFKGERRWSEESLTKVCRALNIEIKIDSELKDDYLHE